MKRRILLAAILCCFMAPTSTGFAGTLRCGNWVVAFGQSAWDVADHCGPPTWVDSRQEDSLVWVDTPVLIEIGPRGMRTWVSTLQRVTVEEWTYDMGPTRFVRYLRFINGRLIDVETGRYGH